MLSYPVIRVQTICLSACYACYAGSSFLKLYVEMYVMHGICERSKNNLTDTVKCNWGLLGWIHVQLIIRSVYLVFRIAIKHNCGVIMGTMASQITRLSIVYSTVNSDADQIKNQSSASLALVRGIHRGPVNSPHKGPATRKMFPFDDVIMIRRQKI